MRKYTALIMDLKESRKYSPENRNKIQTYILKVANILNTAFKGSLEKVVSFSAGDELQGLFGRVEAAYLYFRLFSMLVAPVEIRAGIGIGEWDVVIENAPSTAQDGSAYHNARKAINATKESLGYSVLLYSGGKNDLIANSLFNSTAIIIGKQSEYQNKVMLLSELLYPINAYGIINVNKLRQAVNLVAQNGKTADNNLLYIDTFENKSKDITEVDDNFFVTEGRVRGLPIQLAEIMGVTRQSVDKTIKTANIYEARNLAVATLKYLKQLGEV